MTLKASLLILCVNIGIAICIFWSALPLNHIPSDDVAFSTDILIMSKCLEQDQQHTCWPRPNYFYTKPSLTLAGGLTHHIVNKFYPLTALDALGLVAILSLSVLSWLCQILLAATTTRKILACTIGGIFVYLSPTVVGSTLWWGYTTLLSLGVYLFWTMLWKLKTTFASLAQTRSKKIKLGLAAIIYFLSALLIGVFTFYIHLSAVPFLACGYALIVAFFLFSNVAHGNILQGIKRIYHPQSIFFTALILLHIGCFAMGVFWVNQAARNNYQSSYLEAYQQNLDANIRAQGRVEYHHVKEKNSILDKSLPVGYYFTGELPLTIFFIFLLLFRWTVLTGAKRRKSLCANVSEILRFFIFSGIMGLILISLGPSTKLLRSTFPAHLAILLCTAALTLDVIERVIFARGRFFKKSAMFLILLVAGLNYFSSAILMNWCLWQTSFSFEHKLRRAINSARERDKIGYFLVEDTSFWSNYLFNVGLLGDPTWLHYRFFGSEPVEGLKFAFFSNPLTLNQSGPDQIFILTRQTPTTVGRPPLLEVTIPYCELPPVFKMQQQNEMKNFIMDFWTYFPRKVPLLYGQSTGDRFSQARWFLY